MFRISLFVAVVATSISLLSGVSHGETIFAVNFDSSKTAGIAVGNPEPTIAGLGVIDSVNVKFGAGSLDPSLVIPRGNELQYETAGNFNASAGTIEMWFRAPDWIGFPRMELFSIFNLPVTYAGNVSLYLLNDNSGGKLAVDVDVAGHNQWALRGASNSILLGDGNWHHVAYEWDTATDHAALFLDGNLETDNNIVGGGSVDFTGGSLAPFMEIGSRQQGYDALAGNIDDVRISKVALYNGQSFTPPTQSTIPDPVEGTPGDFDNDGDVDGRDFLAWQRGGSPSALSAGDLQDWQQNYGASGLASFNSVPEPSTGLLLILLSIVPVRWGVKSAEG